MSSEQKLFWVFVVVLAVVAGALLLSPNVEEMRAPELRAAHVAIQPEGASAAVLGPVELEAGTPFTLYAVLEAEARDGAPVYYTEAPALERGGEDVPAEQLRTWDRPQTARVLWRTIEGSKPVLDLAPGDSLERFELLAFVRDTWPYAWTIPGRLEPANDDPLAAPGSQVERPFGTQRYQVRIELYDDEQKQLLPSRSFDSWGPGELPERVEEFPTVTARLPGPAGPASAVFGLTHVRAPGEDGTAVAPPAATGAEAEAPDLLTADGTLPRVPENDLRQDLVRLTRQRLAFATLPLLREMLTAAGIEPDALPWRYVSLDGTASWGDEVHPGDLLRAGGRVVVLYADAAAGQAVEPLPAAGNGVLDRDDLVFDYAFQPAVRPLCDIFEGEGGQVEWVPLGGPSASGAGAP